ncbi:MAG: hypothetical protein AAF740_02015 [Bacteroidota bacterium]
MRNLILVPMVVMIAFYGLKGYFRDYAKRVKDKHCLTTQISSRLFDFNTFELKVDSSLNLDGFKVVNQNSGKVIFENGKSQKGIGNGYGNRMFSLYYKERKEYEFGHFSTNNWHTYDYKLHLSKGDDRVEPDLKIVGSSSAYNDFFYKRFEYNDSGKLERISYLTLGKVVYNVKEINE